MKKKGIVLKRFYAAMLMAAGLCFLFIPSGDEVLADESASDYGTLVKAGSCGNESSEANDTVTWTIYEKAAETENATAEYTLVIRGTGEMADYSYNSPWKDDSYSRVIIESGVTSIGTTAFAYSKHLTTVSIPDSVKSIGEGAFYKSKLLKQITVSQQLESIGNAAFYECSMLERITIPASVTDIGELAFRRCNRLYIKADAQNPYFTSIEGALFDKSMETLLWYPSAYGVYCIPDGVNTISSMAFEGSDLTQVTLPNSVKRIEMYAFEGCIKLEKVSLSDELKAIERNAFDGCSSLTSIDIPDGVESIGANTFYGCSSLSQIHLPNGITSIEEGIFYGCRRLETIMIPDTVTSIGAEAFLSSGLTAADIPAHVTDIGEKAFYQCRNLVTVNISYGVISIGDRAFAECSCLQKIVIPDSVKSLGEKVFENCNALQSICYPGTLDMENAGIPDTTVRISYTVNADGSVSVRIEKVPRGVTEIEIPDVIAGKTVTSIDKNGIKITVSHNHTSGGAASCKHEAACSVCGELYLDAENHVNTEIRDARAASCKEVGYTGDLWCKDCEVMITAGSIIEKLSTHTWDAGTVTKEPTTAEAGEKTYICTICGVTRIEKLEKIESITDTGVDNKIPQKGTILTHNKSKARYKVTKAGQTGGTVEYYRSINKKAKTITIPATVKIQGITYKVTSVAAKAFKNNKKITSVKIGSNVTTIGKEAFSGCKKLKTVTFGKKVTTIKAKAFYKCTAIKKITLPSKVRTIGKQAFYGCKALKNLTIKTTKLTKKKVGAKAFTGTYKGIKVKVPAKKYKAYKTLLKSKGINRKAKITK